MTDAIPSNLSPALLLGELLKWNDESTRNWLAFLAANPAVLQLPCGIYKTDSVLGLVHHVIVVELRHSQRLARLPVAEYEDISIDSIEKLASLHGETVQRFQTLLDDPNQDWNAALEFITLTAGTLRATRRKLLAHTLMHAIRHWAQLATLVRNAGYSPGINGDLLLSAVLD